MTPLVFIAKHLTEAQARRLKAAANQAGCGGDTYVMEGWKFDAVTQRTRPVKEPKR